MCSLGTHPGLNTRATINVISSNVWPATAKEGMAVMFVDTLTKVMQTQQVIFSAMRKFAGEVKRLRKLLPQRTLMLLVTCCPRWSSKTAPFLTEFQWIGKGKITYKHTQHTTAEARCITFNIRSFPVLTPWSRAEIVRWVSESKWPFEIVNRAWHG